MTVPYGSDILLQRQGQDPFYFRVDRKSYRFSDLSAYAPRSAMGGLTLADQEHVNAMEQISWAGGMGHIKLTDANRYKYGDGVDPRHAGMLTLFSERTSFNITGLTGKLVTACDGTYVYIGGIGGVRRWNGTTVTTINTGLANTNVISLFWNGESLFAGLDNHRIHRWGGASWTSVGQTYSSGTNDFSATSICIHNGAHWHSQGDTNLVHFWFRGDGADAETGIAVGSLDGSYTHPAEGVDYDPTALEVGPLGRSVKALASHNGFLYAFRDDGIWEIFEYQDRRYGTRLVRDMTDTANYNNFNAIARREDGLWFGQGFKLERYTGQQSADFTPNPIDETFPPVVHDSVQALYDVQGWMFGLVSGQLYCFNGTSIHILERNVTGSSAPRTLGLQPAVMGYYPLHNILYVAVYNGTNTDVYHWKIEDTYSRAPYKTYGYMETSTFDGGLRDVPKFWHSLKLETHIPDEGGYIKVTTFSHNDNSIDTYYLGQVDSTNAEATVDSRWNKALTTLFFPRTAVGKWLDMKIEFYRGDGALDPTPILYGWLLEYVQRNPTIYGFAPIIQLDDEDQDTEGWSEEGRTRDRLQELLDMRDSVPPLYFEDFFGNAGWVYISAITIREREIKTIADWDGLSADVSVSLVMLARECQEVVIEDGETLTVEDSYIVNCRLVIEGSGRLIVENS